MHSICYVIHEGLEYEDAIKNEDLLAEDDELVQEWLQEGHGGYTYRDQFKILRVQDISSQNIRAFISVSEDGWRDLDKDASNELGGVMSERLQELGEDPEKVWQEYVKKVFSEYPPDTAVVLAAYHF